MLQITPRLNYMKLLSGNSPRAIARLQGDGIYSEIWGYAYFYQVLNGGILVEAEVFNLPDSARLDAPAFYAFHLHENGDCSEHFTKTGEHYNPNGVKHPMHAGDLPPILSNDGYAWLAFYDSRLELYEIEGRSLVIHRYPDDFTTQPSGASGKKIACGVIRFTENQ